MRPSHIQGGGLRAPESAPSRSRFSFCKPLTARLLSCDLTPESPIGSTLHFWIAYCLAVIALDLSEGRGNGLPLILTDYIQIHPIFVKGVMAASHASRLRLWGSFSLASREK